ncbi:MAG: hypothetical protein ABI949_01925 [Ilumatobacteraceae bacterium]
MVEPIEPKRRSRRTLIGVTAGVVVAGALVAYGFSRSDDNRVPANTPPTIGGIQAPAVVLSTQDLVVTTSQTTPGTVDVPVVPGTVDVGFPPVSSNILVP